MRAPRISADEQFRLIMECRASGLTDYEWCLQNDIKPGTFYNWVKRLRQKGCIDIPDTMFLFYHKSHLKGSRKSRKYSAYSATSLTILNLRKFLLKTVLVCW